MSHQRELREAELAVIEAAERWRALVSWLPDLGAPSTANDLAIAVDQLRELRADFDAEAPAVAVNTSIAAAREIDPKVGSIRRKVLLTVLARNGHGWGGYTVDALEAEMKRSHQTVSSAVNWLKENGWLEASGLYGRTRSGSKAIIWTPTERALAEAARIAEEESAWQWKQGLGR